jgi:ATP-dependent DNA ligase
MLAKLVRQVPRGDYAYEPKWDGFRTIAYRDGDAVELQSRNEKALGRYFPEVVRALRTLDEPRFAVDGEIVVVRDGVPDFAALMARLHPAKGRVARLEIETPGLFVAFDLLARGDDDLRREPFTARRAALVELFRGEHTHAMVTPSTEDIAAAEAWLAGARAGIDGVIAKPRGAPYEPGRRSMIKVKREHTADCVVAGLRFAGASTDRAGALLLGIYDGDALIHVGVASQFTDELRQRFVRELLPTAVPLAGHPWEHGFGLERSPLGRLAGAAGRWVPGMVPDWIPLEPTRVCEVAYGIRDGRRFRHPARFVAWRLDRDPKSCRFDQFEER